MTPALVSSILTGLFAFAVMAVIAMICAVLIKLIVAVLARSTRAVAVAAKPSPGSAAPLPAALPPVAAAPLEISEEFAIIIAAACSEMVGAHRIVYLAETPRAANWTTEVRTRHHLSHVPHR